MAKQTTRKSLLALATLLGVSAGVVAWPEAERSEANTPEAEPAATPTATQAEGPVNDPCPACGRAFASPQGQEFLDAYTAEGDCIWPR